MIVDTFKVDPTQFNIMKNRLVKLSNSKTTGNLRNCKNSIYVSFSVFLIVSAWLTFLNICNLGHSSFLHPNFSIGRYHMFYSIKPLAVYKY